MGKTGRIIREGYGLSETSPVATFNPPISNTFSGTIGIPVPSTDIAILDDEGHQLAPVKLEKLQFVARRL